MSVSLSRRRALAGAMLAVPAIVPLPGMASSQSDGDTDVRLRELERAHGGRLGVAVLNLSTGAAAGHRAGERFLLCSTFKTLLAAFILSHVDRGEDALDRRVTFSPQDVVVWSPLTKDHAGAPGMTIAELCEAAVTQSDNTAANVLLATCGGPVRVTEFVRGLGDAITRLDRIEPALNEHDGPGDLRDTTTPAAMLETLRRLFFTDALSRRSRSQLAAWHIANRTGDERLRAGLPHAWLVGDKTGTNGSGAANDVAVAWAPDRGAVIVTAYCDMPAVTGRVRNEVIAEVGRIASRV